MDCPRCNSDHSSQSPEDLSSIFYQSSEKRSKPIDHDLIHKLGLTYDDLADLLPEEEFKLVTKSEPDQKTPSPEVPVERIPVLSFSTDVSKDIIHDFNKETQLYQKSVQGTSQADENEEPCAKCFQYLLDHEDYPLDDYEQVTVSIRSPSGNSEKRKRAMLELQKDLKLYRESIPADAGLPLTIPRRSAIPKRPMSYSIERDMDLDSTPPLRFLPKKTSTPKSGCCHSNNPNIYFVSTPQESTPFRNALKTSFADSNDSNTNKSKKKSSRKYPLTDLRKSYNKKTDSLNKDILDKKPRKMQKKGDKKVLTRKMSPIMTTILPKRPMEKVVSEVFERRPEEINCCLLVNNLVETKSNAIEIKQFSPFGFPVEPCAHQNKRFVFDSSHSPLSNQIASLHEWGDQTRTKMLDPHNLSEIPMTPNKANIILIEYESNHEHVPCPTLIEIESNGVLKQSASGITPTKLEQIRQLKEVPKKKTEELNFCKKSPNEKKKTNKQMSSYNTKKFSSNETIEKFHTPQSSFSEKSKSRHYKKSIPVKHAPVKKLKANSFPSAPFSYLPKIPPLYYRDQAFTTPKQKFASSRNRKSVRFHCSSRPLMHIDSLTDIESTSTFRGGVTQIKNRTTSKELSQSVPIKRNWSPLPKRDFLKLLDEQKKSGYTSFNKKDSNLPCFDKHLSSLTKRPCRTIFKNTKPRKLRRSTEELRSSKYPPKLFNHEKLMMNYWHIKQIQR